MSINTVTNIITFETAAKIKTPELLLRDVQTKSPDYKRLCEQIKSYSAAHETGNFDPIKVYRDEGKDLYIVDGLQRLHACIAAKCSVLILTVSENDAVEIMTNSNHTRVAAKPAQLCNYLVKLITLNGYNQAELQKITGMSQEYLKKILKLNRLTDTQQLLLDGGKMSLANASLLIDINSSIAISEDMRKESELNALSMTIENFKEYHKSLIVARDLNSMDLEEMKKAEFLPVPQFSNKKRDMFKADIEAIFESIDIDGYEPSIKEQAKIEVYKSLFSLDKISLNEREQNWLKSQDIKISKAEKAAEQK